MSGQQTNCRYLNEFTIDNNGIILCHDLPFECCKFDVSLNSRFHQYNSLFSLLSEATENHSDELACILMSANCLAGCTSLLPLEFDHDSSEFVIIFRFNSQHKHMAGEKMS